MVDSSDTPAAGGMAKTGSAGPPTEALNDAEKWAAVEARDGGYDGSFVYAVRTTGVYCPPSCGSRRPKRENVEFFDAPEAAESAGYRACKRAARHLKRAGYCAAHNGVAGVIPR